MKKKLSAMTTAELNRLRSRIDTELKRRDTAARRDVLKQFKKIASEHGMSLNDVIGAPKEKAPASTKPARKASPAKGRRIPMKYRHPSDPAMGWTGRGRQPRWAAEWVESGKSIDELLIK